MQTILRMPFSMHTMSTMTPALMVYIQCICHFFDKSIRTMVEHAAEVISPIIELLVDIVASNATPSAIDLVQQILLLYVDTKKVGLDLSPCLRLKIIVHRKSVRNSCSAWAVQSTTW